MGIGLRASIQLSFFAYVPAMGVSYMDSLLRFKDPDPYLISTEPPFSDIYISKSKTDFNMRVFSSSSA